jgi:hypothetical protein
MLEILLAVRRVHDQQILIGLEPVEVGIVEGSAVLVGDQRVLRAGGTVVECLGVVRERVLEERQRVAAADPKPSHVRHVEDAGVATDGQVLGDRAGRVLEWHLPARERDDPRAELDVAVVEDGPVGGVHRRRV